MTMLDRCFNKHVDTISGSSESTCHNWPHPASFCPVALTIPSIGLRIYSIIHCFAGGGCSEMVMSNAVTKLAEKTPGKEAVAMEAFARSLRQVKYILPKSIYLSV